MVKPNYEQTKECEYEISAQGEFPVIFRAGPKFRYDFRPVPKIHRINYYKKRSAEQHLFP
jgi:hypothetical protein